MKNLYVVLSQPGTIVSKIIKLLTGDTYTHASISLDGTLDELYSFGRIYPSNPVLGGFVKESKNYGTFKKFHKTRVVVMQTTVSDETYAKVNDCLQQMYAKKKEFKYNYRGLFLAYFNKVFVNDKHFYCSEFVRDILTRCGIIDNNRLSGIVKPEDFLALPSKKWGIVYVGRLQSFVGLPQPQ